MCLRLGLLILLALLGFRLPAASPEVTASFNRGRVVYLANCSMCHQVTGRGVPGTYPPVAESDFLRENLRESILAIVQGLNRPITVNGRAYHGQMPAVALNDASVADVMSFMLNSWNNPGGQVTADQVREIRSKSAFPTYEALAAANAYKPLPSAPPGFALHEVIRLTDFATRLASDGQGRSAMCSDKAVRSGDLTLSPKNTRQSIWPRIIPELLQGIFRRWVLRSMTNAAYGSR